MNFLAFAFLTALCFSVMLTPVIRRLGTKLGAVDKPDHRKVQGRPIPRIGGIALVSAFLGSLTIGSLFFFPPATFLPLDLKLKTLLVGSFIVFGIGLWDDFHRVGPGIKLLFQVVAASVAFWGGVQIDIFWAPSLGSPNLLLSYLLTVFWFVLFVNALNLIDGLDGLAAGVTFFTCSVMTLLSFWRGDQSTGLLFGVLAGVTLGFLRYNFNPASIFMGDGGSYFLGYCIAGISILSSSKSQVGATILMPLVALGIPIFDTILSPIRRFFMGKKMFRPDTGHIHHKLVALGFSTSHAVLTIYVLSSLLCLLSLVVVNLRDRAVGAFLISLGLVALLFIKKLGYLEFIAKDNVVRWIKDVSDEVGLTRDRRSFLNLQIDINDSKDLNELWENTCEALKVLDFDMSRVKLEFSSNGATEPACGPEGGSGNGRTRQCHLDGPEAEGNNGNSVFERVWTQNGFASKKDKCEDCLLKLELPLLDEENKTLGTLWLIKDLKRSLFGHYTLRRVEHLRRTITRTLEKLRKGP